VLAHARKFQLTHIVYRDPPYEWENAAMKAFREQFAVPVWRANGIVVAEIRPAQTP
jgi:16S rRNA G966 N2-methylase RsmD